VTSFLGGFNEAGLRMNAVRHRKIDPGLPDRGRKIMKMGRVLSSFVGTALLLCYGTAWGTGPASAESPQVTRGRYIAIIGGCNDCHTAGYMQSDGKVPEERWLAGDTLGWRGPWGTTYATNLRRFMQNLSEDQWVILARNLRTRPPMPWYNLHHMEESDVRALYQFIRFLGPTGKDAPAFLPPDQTPPPPFAQFP